MAFRTFFNRLFVQSHLGILIRFPRVLKARAHKNVFCRIHRMAQLHDTEHVTVLVRSRSCVSAETAGAITAVVKVG